MRKLTDDKLINAENRKHRLRQKRAAKKVYRTAVSCFGGNVLIVEFPKRKRRNITRSK
jgi:hypothetical protein